MKKRHALLITGFCLILGGLALGYAPFMTYWHGKHVAQVLTVPFSTAARAGLPQSTTPAPTEVVSGEPVRIEIPSLKIDLQVAEGHYNSTAQTWTLSKDKAHYAVNTPLANNAEGNTFIYGHNRKAVFARLVNIKAGATAIVTTKNGHRFTYTFRSAFETQPSDDSLFEYKGPAILTLQTCSGLWYQNRQLFTFDFVSVTDV
jgi:LPXTG-site transpeptidase (sortase) family protein